MMTESNFGLDLSATILPCGSATDCGVFLKLPGLIEPVEMARTALGQGWDTVILDGAEVLVCEKCAKEPLGS